jgi:hypothetical protein
MLNWLKRSLLMLVSVQIIALNLTAAPVTMPPLPPPAWINITNITPTGATATWQAVGSGTVWYNARLEETATGTLVYQHIQTQTSRIYDALTPGVSYTLKVSASTDQNGPWGPSAIKEFRTTIIVLDDICTLSQPATQPPAPNAQTPPYSSATSQVGNAGNYTICMPKVNLAEINWNKATHAFHAYIQPLGSEHFFEFAMVAGTDNGLHFSNSPLKLQGDGFVWTTRYYGATGQEYFINPLGSAGSPTVPPPIVRVVISYGTPSAQTSYLTIFINELPSDDNTMTVGATVAIPNTVFYGVNNCTFSTATTCGESTGGTKSKVAADAYTSAANAWSDPEKDAAPEDAVLQISSRTALPLVTPNPFQSSIQLQLSDFSIDLDLVRILNPQGQVMVTLSKNQLQDGVVTISTDEWVPCMYFVQMLSAGGIVSVPIVKM